ncbi:hypothetical protein MLD38_008426 [Melastoma candidum]|uniref:Uncharacterized protein n=1 Tax=Melastoma candidum TaxID=119954 RepID=A0ACB9RVL1_9MYRT|nr:hypothetical protein MLD38_008426 [Melastoma candidum]
MASHGFPSLLLAMLVSVATSAPAELHSLNCSEQIRACSSSLYYHNNNVPVKQIALHYSVNESQIQQIQVENRQDYLINVTCSCQTIEKVTAYFYNTSYYVEEGQTFDDISSGSYNDQAFGSGNEGDFSPFTTVPIYIPCGCLQDNSKVMVTYTVQPHDTLSDIAALLSADVDGIISMNIPQIQNADNIYAGSVLFIPKSIHAIPRPKKGAAPDAPVFESEKPMVYSLEQIESATDNFDESKKIGEGGYGSVYFGYLGKQEVAIKKMKSSKSKEFLAELKVLCKIHHINVVELIGYASGEDHLYLVYEFIPNGSLSEHLHDPFLKGHQPLSWTVRTEIALDAARGIEYIHDHTKAQYVHRDIKTSNILLDEGHRAKVSDFGLARLVGRTGEEDLIATRLVGTPGYLPPESVKELQVTPKTDVFAYGVVLAELITGQRALIRDSKEPTKLISLITIMNKIFRDDDPPSAIEVHIDTNLRGNYPTEEVYRMAEIVRWCLSEDPADRPEMREIVVTLSQIRTSSVEWEASLGENSQFFSGLHDGR